MGGEGLIVTSAGAYNVDYDKAYAERKAERELGRRDDSYERLKQRHAEVMAGQHQFGLGGRTADPPRNYLNRDELIQNCEANFARERSKSNEKGRSISPDGPMPRQRAPVPQRDYDAGSGIPSRGISAEQIFRLDQSQSPSRDAFSGLAN